MTVTSVLYSILAAAWVIVSHVPMLKTKKEDLILFKITAATLDISFLLEVADKKEISKVARYLSENDIFFV